MVSTLVLIGVSVLCLLLAKVANTELVQVREKINPRIEAGYVMNGFYLDKRRQALESRITILAIVALVCVIVAICLFDPNIIKKA